MERHLKKPCIPSRASSFGCLQERRLPPCRQRGTMLQDAPGQLASRLVSSAAVQSLSDACCEISLGFQAESSGKRGTGLPRKSGPQPFCLQPQKQAVGKKFPFQRPRKENQSRQKYLACCIVYVKCPVLFHLFCDVQKCCRTVRGEKQIIVSTLFKFCNGVQSGRHLGFCQMSSPHSVTWMAAPALWGTDSGYFRELSLGSFYYLLFFPSLFLNHDSVASLLLTLLPGQTLSVRRLQPSLRCLPTIRRKPRRGLVWIQMPDAVWAYLTSDPGSLQKYLTPPSSKPLTGTLPGLQSFLPFYNHKVVVPTVEVLFCSLLCSFTPCARKLPSSPAVGQDFCWLWGGCLGHTAQNCSKVCRVVGECRQRVEVM